MIDNTTVFFILQNLSGRSIAAVNQSLFLHSQDTGYGKNKRFKLGIEKNSKYTNFWPDTQVWRTCAGGVKGAAVILAQRDEALLTKEQPFYDEPDWAKKGEKARYCFTSHCYEVLLDYGQNYNKDDKIVCEKVLSLLKELRIPEEQYIRALEVANKGKFSDLAYYIIANAKEAVNSTNRETQLSIYERSQKETLKDTAADTSDPNLDDLDDLWREVQAQKALANCRNATLEELLQEGKSLEWVAEQLSRGATRFNPQYWNAPGEWSKYLSLHRDNRLFAFLLENGSITGIVEAVPLSAKERFELFSPQAEVHTTDDKTAFLCITAFELFHTSFLKKKRLFALLNHLYEYQLRLGNAYKIAYFKTTSLDEEGFYAENHCHCLGDYRRVRIPGLWSAYGKAWALSLSSNLDSEAIFDMLCDIIVVRPDSSSTLFESHLDFSFTGSVLGKDASFTGTLSLEPLTLDIRLPIEVAATAIESVVSCLERCRYYLPDCPFYLGADNYVRFRCYFTGSACYGYISGFWDESIALMQSYVDDFAKAAHAKAAQEK